MRSHLLAKQTPLEQIKPFLLVQANGGLHLMAVAAVEVLE